MSKRKLVKFKAVLSSQTLNQILYFDLKESCFDYKRNNAPVCWLTLSKIYDDGTEEVVYDGL